MRQPPHTSIIIQFVALAAILFSPIVPLLTGDLPHYWYIGFMSWWVVCMISGALWHRNKYPHDTSFPRVSLYVERVALSLFILMPLSVVVTGKLMPIVFSVVAGWYLAWAIVAALWSRNVRPQ